MKITKLQEYSLYDDMSLEFINSFDSFLTESNKHKPLMTDILSDLKINTKLVMTFGGGIGSFLPIIENLLTNMKLEADIRTILLLSICAFTIIYIEEKKYKTAAEGDLLIKDSKSMLEELRLHGIGNGIVKKLVQVLKSIVGIFNLIGKHVGYIIETFIDMFAYAALLIPIMNGLSFVVGKYDLTIDSFIVNISGLALGIGSIIAKRGVMAIVNKLKLKDSVKKEIVDEVDTSVVQTFTDFNPEDGEMINEEQ